MPYSNSLEWLEKQVMRLLGAGTPIEQMVAALVLGVAIIASGSISLGFTLLLLPIPILMFFVGALRLVPAIDGIYPL